MNKPKGYVTTVKRSRRAPTVMDLLRGVGARVYPVGRLDYASEGLLLLTNDGELANFTDEGRLARPQNLHGESRGNVPTLDGSGQIARGE